VLDPRNEQSAIRKRLREATTRSCTSRAANTRDRCWSALRSHSRVRTLLAPSISKPSMALRPLGWRRTKFTQHQITGPFLFSFFRPSLRVKRRRCTAHFRENRTTLLENGKRSLLPSGDNPPAHAVATRRRVGHGGVKKGQPGGHLARWGNVDSHQAAPLCCPVYREPGAVDRAQNGSFLAARNAPLSCGILCCS